ncbi:MauE/DoxX family redox-associated membrane protein [Chimaeribacter arupi]|uniref:MauE/DoxX family redox-associated membrane protein n=1 Tax=Chimaeribacter arupi TaxID=2060066 RepID=UPI0019D4EDBA|nr:MauE/DoxX family redox-associated membrane protein [Chimaeribacter arupi]MDV5139713.1 MauE/DoxX family redox-associated membrane protein [Chimaeribacter arupi]
MAALCDMLHLCVLTFLTLLFGQAALHKAGDVRRFSGYVADYGVVAPALALPVTWLLVVAEGAAMGLTLTPATSASGLMLMGALLALYGGAMLLALRHGKRHIDCGCGGATQPLSRLLVVRNAVLLALAGLAALTGGQPVAPLNLAVAILSGLVLWLGYQLLDQLLRLHSLRAQLSPDSVTP